MTIGRLEAFPGTVLVNGYNGRNIFYGYTICGIDITERSGKNFNSQRQRLTQRSRLT
jgi:hypothetical protein